MTTETDLLIERLSREAAPLRRLRPPMWRALGWLLCAALAAAGCVLLFGRLAPFQARLAEPHVRMEVIGTLATFVLAVVAAFHLSLPDRSPGWSFLPLPALALWMAGSGMGCYQDWFTHNGTMWKVGESGECLAIIVGVAAPLSAALLWALRKARPLSPVAVAVVAGLGSAAFGAFILEFFHDVPATFMDLTLHVAGVAAVVLACRAAARRVVGS